MFHYRIHGGGRINPGVKLRFREHYATLRRKHPALFAREPELRAALPAAALVAAALPRCSSRVALRLPPGLVRPLLDIKHRLRPLVAWVDAARR